MNARRYLFSMIADDFQMGHTMCSANSHDILRTAQAELNAIINKKELSDDKIKQQCDIVIVGALIYVSIYNDKVYGIQAHYGNKFLYPLTFDDVKLQAKALDAKILELGTRALIKKDIPFTGEIHAEMFPKISRAILPGHFECYHLNKDPKSMLTAQALQEEARAAYNKEVRPFGWPEQKQESESKSTNPQESDFNLRKAEVIKVYDDQVNKVKKQKRKVIGLTVLAAIFLTPLSLIFSVRWAKKQMNAVNYWLTWQPLQKVTFTAEGYQNTKKLRAELKKTFPKSSAAISEKLNKGIQKAKFKKVCIAYDATGKETQDKDKIATIDMYGDRAKMQRWNIAKLTHFMSLGGASACAGYENTKQESCHYTAEEPFKSFKAR